MMLNAAMNKFRLHLFLCKRYSRVLYCASLRMYLQTIDSILGAPFVIEHFLLHAMTEITSETSSRICHHMNDDHGLSVYGMAISLHNSKGEIKNVKMTNISLAECSLSYIVCRGDLCEMKTASYPFQPPLTSVAESRSRLVKIHNKVMSPEFLWLLTDSLAFSILLTCASLGLATYVGAEGVETYLDDNVQGLSRNLTMVFGSTRALARVVIGAFWFALITHAVEAFYCAYHAVSTMKLKPAVACKWFSIVSLVGYPIQRRFVALLKVHYDLAQEKKK